MPQSAPGEEAAKALNASVLRFDFGSDVPKAALKEMVELTEMNMNEFSSQEALQETRSNISNKFTRIICVRSKERGKKLVGFAAYRLNCNEGGEAVAYLYELQMAVEARGQKPSLGKALCAT